MAPSRSRSRARRESRGVLRVDAPLTAKQPRARVEAGNEKKASDILRSNDQYRLNIQANPTVPMLDIYARRRLPIPPRPWRTQP